MNRITRFKLRVRPQLLTTAAAGLLVVSAWSQITLNRSRSKSQDADSTLVAMAENNLFHQAVLGASTKTERLSTAVDQAVQPAFVPDCSQLPCVALTFDDGPDNTSTPQIMNVLNQNNAKATFYLIGRQVATAAEVVKQLYAGGFEIGNHSWAHPDFRRLNTVEMDNQITQTQAAITAVGVPAPTTFRPPYGYRNLVVNHQIKMPMILWNVDPKDWAETDSHKLLATIQSQVKPGSIILMHDRQTTARALPYILADLKQHYYLVTVDQLLNLPTGSQGQFYGRL